MIHGIHVLNVLSWLVRMYSIVCAVHVVSPIACTHVLNGVCCVVCPILLVHMYSMVCAV